MILILFSANFFVVNYYSDSPYNYYVIKSMKIDRVVSTGERKYIYFLSNSDGVYAFIVDEDGEIKCYGQEFAGHYRCQHLSSKLPKFNK